LPDLPDDKILGAILEDDVGEIRPFRDELAGPTPQTQHEIFSLRQLEQSRSTQVDTGQRPVLPGKRKRAARNFA
ncbi:MAG TPA: hypothetical protein VGL24_04715, partial [Chthoniobacterales bacterium]